jgi:hypothetical protein
VGLTFQKQLTPSPEDPDKPAESGFSIYGAAGVQSGQTSVPTNAGGYVSLLAAGTIKLPAHLSLDLNLATAYSAFGGLQSTDVKNLISATGGFNVQATVDEKTATAANVEATTSYNTGSDLSSGNRVWAQRLNLGIGGQTGGSARTGLVGGNYVIGGNVLFGLPLAGAGAAPTSVGLTFTIAGVIP